MAVDSLTLWKKLGQIEVLAKEPSYVTLDKDPRRTLHNARVLNPNPRPPQKPRKRCARAPKGLANEGPWGKHEENLGQMLPGSS